MFIYEIVNLIDGKRYIGRSIDIATRWKHHIYCLNTSRHENCILQNAWNKYGYSNFKFNIIDQAFTEDELDEKEIYWITCYNSTDRKFGYNIMNGGSKSNHSTGRLQKSITLRPNGYELVVDSHGVVYQITTLREFARKHNLTQPGLRSVVVTKKCYHYKGWRLATSDTIGISFEDITRIERGKRISFAKLKEKYPDVICPNGTIYSVGHLSNFCKLHNLSMSNMSMLLRNKKESYKGWKLFPTVENNNG
jgi:hypothetical protein